jgi:CheY-like chemotaxis protein
MKILIAEDEPDIAKSYELTLESRSHDVIITNNGQECLKVYKENFQQLKLQRTSSTKTLAESSTSTSDMFQHPWQVSSSPSSPTSSSSQSPFDVVILDYKMPKISGMEVAKEILKINPSQRIIFASAYVKETLEESVKQLKQVVELIQKPFNLTDFVNTIEDRAVCDELKKLVVNINQIKNEEHPTDVQMRNIFEGLRKIQKYRTF